MRNRITCTVSKYHNIIIKYREKKSNSSEDTTLNKSSVNIISPGINWNYAPCDKIEWEKTFEILMPKVNDLYLIMRKYKTNPH